MNRRNRKTRRGGFLLLETMIGVMVFAIGVLSLAQCVSRCLDVENAKVTDERARMALENRMAEIEAGSVFFETGKEEKLKGMFQGITLNQTRTPLHFVEANKQELAGLYQIQLEALWEEPSGVQSKVLTFYVYAPR